MLTRPARGVALVIRLTDPGDSSTSPSDLGQELDADMIEAIGDYEETFIWGGVTYACVINHTNSSLIVAKSLFNAAVYPQFGDQIEVAGQTYQVKSLNDSEGFLTAGGIVEDRPFVDAASSPALRIGFGKFISK
jgi:hypothetical protein